MIIIDCKQREMDWHKARAGRVTSTGVKRIITPKTKALAAGRAEYMRDLLTERWRGWPKQTPTTYTMERGIELEPKAREWYRENIATVHEVGFVLREDEQRCGCSPDGLYPALSIGLEIKCPLDETQIAYLLAGTMPEEYVPQVQWMMWVTEFERWDFLSWHPELPPLLVACKPDPAWQSAFDEHIPTFLAEYEEAWAKLDACGVEAGAMDRALADASF